MQEPPKIEISDAKKGLHPPGATSRRGSLIPPEDAGGRRPSLINADEVIIDCQLTIKNISFDAYLFFLQA